MRCSHLCAHDAPDIPNGVQRVCFSFLHTMTGILILPRPSWPGLMAKIRPVIWKLSMCLDQRGWGRLGGWRVLSLVGDLSVFNPLFFLPPGPSATLLPLAVVLLITLLATALSSIMKRVSSAKSKVVSSPFSTFSSNRRVPLLLFVTFTLHACSFPVRSFTHSKH